MTKYNTLNVKLCNSQISKLKSGIKIGTGVTLNLSSNLFVVLMMRPMFYMFNLVNCC